MMIRMKIPVCHEDIISKVIGNLADILSCTPTGFAFDENDEGNPLQR